MTDKCSEVGSGRGGWSGEDILRVERINSRDGDNHLPITKRHEETPTWWFYERFIHILEGDVDFDFDDFTKEDYKKVDWQEIKIVIEKMTGEEPEEYDGDISKDAGKNLDNMRYVVNFLVCNFKNDFGIQIPEE